MAALSSTPFVSLAKLPDALQLTGEKASRPLSAGQTVAVHGYFDDGSHTGLAVMVVLRASGKHHHFEMAPIGCIDPYWGAHLQRSPSVSAKLISRPGEKAIGEIELITRWRVLSEAGSEPLGSDLQFLGKVGAVEAAKRWNFLSDYVVSEKEAGNDTSLR